MEFNKETFEKALNANRIVRYEKHFEAVVKSYLEIKNQALRQPPVSGMCFLQWTCKKPEFDTECILICANQFRGEWEYSIYQIKKVFFEDKWYWGWINGDGDEVGDLADLRAQMYYVIPPITVKRLARGC